MDCCGASRASQTSLSCWPLAFSRTIYSVRAGLFSLALQSRTLETGVDECFFTVLVSLLSSSDDDKHTERENGHLRRCGILSRDYIPTGHFGNNRPVVFGRHQQGFVIPALLLLDTADG